jgi:hypothetical protein
MNVRYILISILLFLIGQSVVWIQVNGPLLWNWARTWKWALMILGVPITWLFMEGTRYAVTGFEGNFWPSRFVSFVSGIIMFTVMTWLFKSEVITLKTVISLCLAFCIIIIQVFWK